MVVARDQKLLNKKNNYQQLKFTNDPRNLSKARKYVEDFAANHGFNEEQVFDIKVATGEAVSNAIEHGSPSGDSEIKISLDFSQGCLEISVADVGIFKRIIKIDDQEDTQHRGRGIPFMLALMDKVTINENKNGTTVKLVKKL